MFFPLNTVGVSSVHRRNKASYYVILSVYSSVVRVSGTTTGSCIRKIFTRLEGNKTLKGDIWYRDGMQQHTVDSFLSEDSTDTRCLGNYGNRLHFSSRVSSLILLTNEVISYHQISWLYTRSLREQQRWCPIWRLVRWRGWKALCDASSGGTSRPHVLIWLMPPSPSALTLIFFAPSPPLSSSILSLWSAPSQFYKTVPCSASRLQPLSSPFLYPKSWEIERLKSGYKYSESKKVQVNSHEW